MISCQLRPVCLLKAFTRQIPSPNPHPAHKPLIQIGYYYTHPSSPTVLRGHKSSDILLSVVVTFLLTRCINSLSVIVVSVCVFLYKCHPVLYVGHIHCCWILFLGPFPVVEEADWTFPVLGVLVIPEKLCGVLQIKNLVFFAFTNIMHAKYYFFAASVATSRWCNSLFFELMING